MPVTLVSHPSHPVKGLVWGLPGIGKTAIAKVLGLNATARARSRIVDPYFGDMVDFGIMWNDHQQEVKNWLEANIEGRHGVDYQIRNNRVSFVRAEDADLCYLAFA